MRGLDLRSGTIQQHGSYDRILGVLMNYIVWIIIEQIAQIVHGHLDMVQTLTALRETYVSSDRAWSSRCGKRMIIDNKNEASMRDSDRQECLDLQRTLINCTSIISFETQETVHITAQNVKHPSPGDPTYEDTTLFVRFMTPYKDLQLI